MVTVPPASLLASPGAPAGPPPSALLGTAPAMVALRRGIEHVAGSSAPVFISGESGTGKELVARAIHGRSARCAGAFVAINAAAIPEHLLESELFGHVRGAFTGAHEPRRGLVVEAHGGTLFLDEVGDMPLALQAKLLRVLQLGEVRAVGSNDVRWVDVRVVSATHRDLPALVAAERFREDLYFRLNVLPLRVPPLRERRGDVAPLAHHFLGAARGRAPSSPVRTLSDGATDVLSSAPWPGNVRELESAVERLVVFGETSIVEASDVVLGGLAEDALVQPDLASLREMSERHVARVLELTRGDKRRAADILGVDVSTLYRWRQRAEATSAALLSAPSTG